MRSMPDNVCEISPSTVWLLRLLDTTVIHAKLDAALKASFAFAFPPDVTASAEGCVVAADDVNVATSNMPSSG